MKDNLIRAIFTNLIFVIGVVITIVGFTTTAKAIANTIAFDKYPLQPYEETQCDFQPMPDQKNFSKEQCLAQLENRRSVNQVNDFVISLSLLTSGVFLVISFRKFIFKK